MNKNINPFIHDEYDLIKKVMFNEQNSKSNCSIGTIVKINTNPVSVDVKNCVKYFDANGGFQEPPVLSSVPVAQIANSVSSIRLPLNIGDVGVLLWFDREVFTWLDSSVAVPKEPDSGNMMNENACIFIPFLTKFSNAPLIKNSGVDIYSNNVSLVEQIFDFIDVINNFATTLSTANSFVDINVAAASLITNLTNVIAQLTTFKGQQT